MRDSLPWMVEGSRNLGAQELAAEDRMRMAARTIEIILFYDLNMKIRIIGWQ
jgi:hypothetical protein